MNDSHSKSHVGAYVTIYLSLIALVLVTVGVAHIKMGALSFPIAMSVAALKTFLIVAVFMHIKDELPLVRIFSYIGLLWLGIFFTILMADYMTRDNMRAVPTAPGLVVSASDAHDAPQEAHTDPSVEPQK